MLKRTPNISLSQSPEKRRAIQEKIQVFANMEKHEKELVILLYTSCKSNSVGEVRQLLAEKRATTSRSGHELSEETAMERVDDLQTLLNHSIDQHGNTLLHVVARSGNSELIKLLLEHGCDPAIRWLII